MTPQQCSIRWKEKLSYSAAQPCVLGMHRKMPLGLEVLRVSSLCHHTEGHRHPDPLCPTVSQALPEDDL